MMLVSRSVQKSSQKLSF